MSGPARCIMTKTQNTRTKRSRIFNYLVDHVTLGVPVLVLGIAIDLDKLLEDRCPAAGTLDSVTERVVVVAVDL